jgi:hypothetical protein
MARSSRLSIFLIVVLLASALLEARGAEIARDRAGQIAQWYFVRYFNEGCGGAGDAVLRGDYWECVVVIGYAATPSGIVRINRRTGRVSYRGPYLLKPSTSAESLERWARSYGQR